MAGKPGMKMNRVNQLLRDMRLVYAQAEEKDLPRHAPLRKMLKEKPDVFLTQLRQAEAAHKAGGSRVSVPGKEQPARPAEVDVQVDEGVEKVEALIEQCLAEWEAD